MSPVFIIVSAPSPGRVQLRQLDVAGECSSPAREVAEADLADLADLVCEREADGLRWVWDDTRRWYPPLLKAGVRVQRCHDLRLCHAILRASSLAESSPLATAKPGSWDEWEPTRPTAATPADSTATTLFDDVERDLIGESASPSTSGNTPGRRDEYAEFMLQQQSVDSSTAKGGLRLLLAAESVGALIAAEIRFAGLPFRADIHDRMLTELAGPRPDENRRPARLEALANKLRGTLDAPMLNPDSHVEVLRAMRRTGLIVSSTRSWELKKLVHPAIVPLLAYKKLSRLLAANGWAWSDAWVRDGRFRPDYVVGGVVTGRWATDGGGALQLPKQVRGAVVADAGWKLVVADAAQLEPRVLAALSHDDAMASAGRGTDLYAGIVANGAITERAQAKVAMLGAMYGATTGESGRLLPTLARAYPRAIHYVDAAARVGERGGIVTSRLGRSSPEPGESWRLRQSQAYAVDASASDERSARSAARDWGRFTRNFVVQATAAEWALCWMAELRRRLMSLRDDASAVGVSGSDFRAQPHLVFFLHDELIVHTPAELAGAVSSALTESAAVAGRLLFQDFPVDFPVTVATVDAYSEA